MHEAVVVESDRGKDGEVSVGRHRVRGVHPPPTSSSTPPHSSQLKELHTSGASTPEVESAVRPLVVNVGGASGGDIDVPMTSVTSMGANDDDEVKERTDSRRPPTGTQPSITQSLRSPSRLSTHNHRGAQSASARSTVSEIPLIAKRTRTCFSMMPVVFALLLIAVLYSIFIGYHCVPNLQEGVEADLRDNTARTWAIVDLVVFNFLFLMLMANYVLCIVTPAGGIPDTSEWHYTGDSDADGILPPRAEVKKTGETRHCRWCAKVKPDRAHHCRVCRKCVLKMDHHCPWIYNCVGWGNHKYFFLLDLYVSAATLYESIRLVGSVVDAVRQPLTPFGKMFLLLFGETLAIFMTIITTGFFLFHVVLMLRAETTIEFCERRFAGHHPIGLFSRGCFNNITEVLGPNPLLWLIPIDNRKGDGIVFLSEASRLMMGFDSTGSKGFDARTSSMGKTADKRGASGVRSPRGSQSTVLGDRSMSGSVGTASMARTSAPSSLPTVVDGLDPKEER